ncbi:hypothetical protein [Haloarcula sp. CGMCC 1.2071]|uniref:hypothetical protein n=1 Tax=Haloarcula sp. CGMCC 1.2071 TaxID=3111454 RepID=UPI00300E9722
MVDPLLIIGALAAVFALLFGAFLAYYRDASRAAQETSRKALGAGLGASGVAVAAVVEGAQVIAEVPALVIGIAGVGSILAGISWEMFAATSVMTYIVMAAIRGD